MSHVTEKKSSYSVANFSEPVVVEDSWISRISGNDKFRLESDCQGLKLVVVDQLGLLVQAVWERFKVNLVEIDVNQNVKFL